MSGLNDFLVVDGLTQVLAEQYNRLVGNTVRGDMANTESLSADKTLIDNDFTLQVLTPDAARNVFLPAAAATNHPFEVVNKSATYTLTVKNAAGTGIESVLPGEAVRFVSDGSVWSALRGLRAGLSVTKQTSGISTDTSSTTFVDVTNATVTVTLAVTSSILVLATGTVTSTLGARETIKALIDGASQGEAIEDIGAGTNKQWSYVALKTSVAAGSREVKLQFKTNGNQVNFYNGLLIAIVIPQ